MRHLFIVLLIFGLVGCKSQQRKSEANPQELSVFEEKAFERKFVISENAEFEVRGFEKTTCRWNSSKGEDESKCIVESTLWLEGKNKGLEVHRTWDNKVGKTSHTVKISEIVGFANSPDRSAGYEGPVVRNYVGMPSLLLASKYQHFWSVSRCKFLPAYNLFKNATALNQGHLTLANAGWLKFDELTGALTLLEFDLEKFEIAGISTASGERLNFSSAKNYGFSEKKSETLEIQNVSKEDLVWGVQPRRMMDYLEFVFACDRAYDSAKREEIERLHPYRSARPVYELYSPFFSAKLEANPDFQRQVAKYVSIKTEDPNQPELYEESIYHSIHDDKANHWKYPTNPNDELWRELYE
jgi:uncharacterized protein YcfL